MLPVTDVKHIRDIYDYDRTLLSEYEFVSYNDPARSIDMMYENIILYFLNDKVITLSKPRFLKTSPTGNSRLPNESIDLWLALHNYKRTLKMLHDSDYLTNPAFQHFLQICNMTEIFLSKFINSSTMDTSYEFEQFLTKTWLDKRLLSMVNRLKKSEESEH